VNASVSDSLAGIDTAMCNGAAATVSSGSVSCSVALGKGANFVSVHAIDQAGNTGSASVRVTRTGTPSGLHVTPGTYLLAIGETRALRAIDDFGEPVTVSWTSDDPDIAEVDSDGVVTAIGAGQATITAEAGTLETEVYVVVSSGTSLPVGSTVWSVDPLPGYVLTTSVGVRGAGSIAFARVETAYDGPIAVETVVRGMDLAGQQVTIATVPLDADETVSGAMSDYSGGVILTVSTPTTDYGSVSLVRVPLGSPTGAWRVVTPSSATALAPDGTIFTMTDRSVIGLNGSTGARTFEIQLPKSRWHIDGPESALDYTLREWWSHSNVTVDAEGRANLLVLKTEKILLVVSDGNLYEPGYVAAAPWNRDDELSLYRITSTGGVSIVELGEYSDPDDELISEPYAPLAVLPDDEGGGLAMWWNCENGPSSCELRGRHVSYNGGLSGEYQLPGGGTVAPSVSGSGKIAFYGSAAAPSGAFDMTDGSAIWNDGPAGSPMASLADNSVAIATATGTSVVDVTGDTIETGLPDLNARFFVDNLWSGASEVVVGKPVVLNPSGYAMQGGTLSNTAGPARRTDLEAAAFEGMDDVWAVANKLSWEWGGYVCRSNSNSSVHYPVFKIGNTAQGVYTPPNEDICLLGEPVAVFHVHWGKHQGATTPSGWESEDVYLQSSDLRTADNQPNRIFFLKTWKWVSPTVTPFQSHYYKYSHGSGSTTGAKNNTYLKLSLGTSWQLQTPLW
jgi:hypothetical protein